MNQEGSSKDTGGPVKPQSETSQHAAQSALQYRLLGWLSTGLFSGLCLLGLAAALRDTGAPPSISIFPGDHIRQFVAIEDWARVESELEAQLRLGVILSERAPLLAHLGRILAIRDKPDEAVDRLRQSLAIDPSSRDTRRLLIVTLTQAGRYEEVVKDSQELLRIAPNEVAVAEEWVGALERLGRDAEAADVRARFTERRPEAADLPCNELTKTTTPARNLILVVSDSLRRDRVGAYGKSGSTQAFDRFANEHLRFDRAVTPAPWTEPAIASLFTGLMPSRHAWGDDSGAKEAPTDAQGRNTETLAEAFTKAGFQTAAFVANPQLGSDTNFARGFLSYDDGFARFETPGSEVTQRGLDWLGTLPSGTPYFLYLHYVDAHAPYGALTPEAIRAAEPVLEGDARPVSAEAHAALQELQTPDGSPLLESTGASPRRILLEAAYDAGISDFDAALGTLLASLETRDDWDQSALIVTSDHGEAFYERGYGHHGRALQEDELSLPLAARLPGIAPATGTVACTTSLIDWRPTLCGYFGLSCESDDGQNLLAGSAPRPDRYVFAEGIPGHPTHRSVRNRRYKMIYEPDGRISADLTRDASIGESHPYELYDLGVDPKERINLLADERRRAAIQPVFEALKNALEAYPPAS